MLHCCVLFSFYNEFSLFFSPQLLSLFFSRLQLERSHKTKQKRAEMHDVERSAAESRANGDLKRSLKWKGHTRMQSKSRIYVALLMLLFFCAVLSSHHRCSLCWVCDLWPGISRWTIVAVDESLPLFSRCIWSNILRLPKCRIQLLGRLVVRLNVRNFSVVRRRRTFRLKWEKAVRSMKRDENRFLILAFIFFFPSSAALHHTHSTLVFIPAALLFFCSSVCLPISLFLLVCSSRALLCSHRVFLTSHTKKEKSKAKQSRARNSSEVWDEKCEKVENTTFFLTSFFCVYSSTFWLEFSFPCTQRTALTTMEIHTHRESRREF